MLNNRCIVYNLSSIVHLLLLLLLLLQLLLLRALFLRKEIQKIVEMSGTWPRRFYNVCMLYVKVE